MAQTKFKPKSGQVDFTNARWAPMMNCVMFDKMTYIVYYLTIK